MWDCEANVSVNEDIEHWTEMASHPVVLRFSHFSM